MNTRVLFTSKGILYDPYWFNVLEKSFGENEQFKIKFYLDDSWELFLKRGDDVWLYKSRNLWTLTDDELEHWE